MKKIGYSIIVILVLALFCLGIGIVTGGLKQINTLYQQSDYQIDLPFYKTVDISKEFSDINNLKISLDIGDLKIVEYAGGSIVVDGKNVNDKIEIESNNETLVIKEGSQWHRLFSGSNQNLTIYVPFDYQFNRIDLDVDAGKIEAEKLTCQHLNVNVDAGSFQGGNIECHNLKATVDAGNIDINYLDCYQVDFDIDVGDVVATMAGSESDYNYDVDSDLGEVMIGSYQSDGLEDRIEFNRGGSRNIVVKIDLGSLKIKMEDESSEKIISL